MIQWLKLFRRGCEQVENEPSTLLIEEGIGKNLRKQWEIVI